MHLFHKWTTWGYVDPSDGTRRVLFQYRTCKVCKRTQKRVVSSYK